MKLIVGLGNPGKKYKKTRHNIGFRVIDELSRSLTEFPPLKENTALMSNIAKKTDLILAQPLTYMNLSKQAIQSISDYYKIDWSDPSHLFLEIRDDLDIPFGQIRIQKGRGAAGHKGAQSTMEVIDPGIIWQFRIGIAGEEKDTMPGDAYVLSQFTKEEEVEVNDIIQRAVKRLKKCLADGPEVAAQEYNQKVKKVV